jgi:hypothetical protein
VRWHNSRYAGEIHLLNIADGRLNSRTVWKSPSVTRRQGLSLSAKGARLAAGGNPATVWDTRTGQELCRVESANRLLDITNVTLNGDGTRLIGATANAITVWDIPTGTPVLTMRFESDVVHVTLSPDEDRLVVYLENGTLKVFDGRAASEVLALRLPVSLDARDFSPTADGSLVASCDRGLREQNVSIWNAKTGEEVLKLRHEMRGLLLNLLAFNRSATRLVARADTGATTVWELPSGRLLAGEPMPTDLVTQASATAYDIYPGSWLKLERPVKRGGEPYDPWAEHVLRRRRAAALWHADNAKAAEEAADWFAAVFHLDHLIRLATDDSSLPERRKAALGRLPADVAPILNRRSRISRSKTTRSRTTCHSSHRLSHCPTRSGCRCGKYAYPLVQSPLG